VHEIDASDIVQIAGAIGRVLKGEPRLARELAQNFLDYEVLARGEQLRMEQFEVGLTEDVPVARVPNFPRDVHDLRALARAFGLRAFTAIDEPTLNQALIAAQTAPGPALIDARIDPSGYRRMLEIVRGASK